MGTVSDYYGNGFRLLRERFQIITGTVSDYYENSFRILREWFQIITRMLLEWFEDIWERFVVTMQDEHR